MERIRCKEIVLESYAVGTMDIMEYADKHPNEYFDYTDVRSKHTDYGRLMVSEDEPDESTLECFERGIYEWHDLPNGWQRFNFGFSWLCHKNGRYIIITS